MSKQKGELRVVLHHNGKHGLYWQATLKGYDLYAASPEKGLAASRVSYHASGAGHVYLGPNRDRLIGPPSQRMDDFIGKEKVGCWSHLDVTWGYSPKRDAVHRRTLILQSPPALAVDLWILQARREELVAEVLQDYRQVRILGQLHVAVTSPQLFAVVYTMTDKGLASLGERVALEQGR